MISFFIPVFFCAVLIYGQIKGVDVFQSFKNGVIQGLDTIKTVFPVLLLIFTSIGMFRESGGMDVVIFLLEPISKITGFPSEAIPVAVLKPFSGSGASAMLESVLKKCGADSFAGKLSAVICASTETTFYTIGLYLSGLKGSFGRILVCSLFADVASFVSAYFAVKFLM